MCLASSVRAVDHFLGIVHCPGQCHLWGTGFQCPHNCLRETLTLEACWVTESVACTLQTMEFAGLSKLSVGYWTVGDFRCSKWVHVSSAGPRQYWVSLLLSGSFLLWPGQWLGVTKPSIIDDKGSLLNEGSSPPSKHSPWQGFEPWLSFSEVLPSCVCSDRFGTSLLCFVQFQPESCSVTFTRMISPL